MLLLLAACGAQDRASGPWTAFVYDHETDHATDTLVGYQSFEACQQGAINKLRTYPEPDRATYECGLSCRYDEQMTVHICAETRD